MSDIEAVIEYLKQEKLMLATAESCTAGLMASTIGAVSGSGAVLECGFVVYSPRAKHRSLGVSFNTIERFGLTSEEVAREMAVGVLEASSADIALANTGVAESGDELDGVVCFAWALRRDTGIEVVSDTRRFDGDRNGVRRAAALHGIDEIPRRHRELRNR
jgi:PncC family amidohydrolase